MATTQAKANPKKKSGFQGVRDAIWIIVACFILAVCFFKFVLGNPDNFVGGDPANAVKDGSLLGTVYKGGIVVPVIITLLFTVIALSIERFFALRTAFGKSSLTKFVINVKQAINAGDMAKAQQICDKVILAATARIAARKARESVQRKNPMTGGGLPGKLESISADTIEDKKGDFYYLVKVRTKETAIRHNDEILPIIPGMIVVADIIIGKKTVLDYILKPVMKARQNALTER